MRCLLGLDDLSIVKYNLCEGQAYDALSSLRQVIQEYKYNLLDKKHNVHGVAAGLRSESFLCILNKDKNSSVHKYWHAWYALVSLGLLKTDKRWQELHDHELWGKNVSVMRSLGDSWKRDPWFWHVVQPAGLSQEQQKAWSNDSMFFDLLMQICLDLYNCSGSGKVVPWPCWSRPFPWRSWDHRGWIWMDDKIFHADVRCLESTGKWGN